MKSAAAAACFVSPCWSNRYANWIKILAMETMSFAEYHKPILYESHPRRQEKLDNVTTKATRLAALLGSSAEHCTHGAMQTLTSCLKLRLKNSASAFLLRQGLVQVP